MAKTLLETNELLLARTTRSEQLISAMLARIDRHNPVVNCYLDVFRESAIARARAMDRELDNGRHRGPLHGIPVAVKDIFDFPGHLASGGSRLARSPGRDQATVLVRLEAAGAILLGSLNLDELAAGGSGDNAHFGRCRNPWNPAHSTGGSSSGSAAAVAAGLACASLGSDAGGSIRIPAAFCGVVGVKPTYGRVSRHGALARTWSMDCIGPLAHSCNDAAAVLNAIGGIDDKDGSSVECTAVHSDINRLARDNLPMIGYPDDPEYRAQRDADANFADAMQRLEEAGYRLRAVTGVDLEPYTRLQQIVVKSEGAAMHQQALHSNDPLLSHAVRSVIEGGLEIPAVGYLEALAMRPLRLRQFLAEAFADCDLLLLPVSLPTAPVFAPTDAWQAADIDRAFSSTATLTRFANYLGLPALSVPSGLSAPGLPTSIQLVARPFEESLMLSVGADYERRRGSLPVPGGFFDT